MKEIKPDGFFSISDFPDRVVGTLDFQRVDIGFQIFRKMVEKFHKVPVRNCQIDGGAEKGQPQVVIDDGSNAIVCKDGRPAVAQPQPFASVIYFS